MYKISWKKTNMFWLNLAFIVLACFAAGMDPNVGTAAATNSVASGLNSVASLGTAVMSIILGIKTAKAFGKGAGFGVGLGILPSIFTIILGLGKAQYVGPQD